MNSNEKKALFSFLFIYVGSTVFLLSILLFSYYQKETEMLDRQCSIEMVSAANELKAKILNAHMEHIPFSPIKLKQENLRYGLFSKDGDEIFSELKNKKINLEVTASHNETHAFHVSKIDNHEDKIDIKYIVIETNQVINEIQKLKIYIIAILLISTVFIACIGYLLAKLLLKPVREKIEHMDKFIKDTAHELNTPITVLMTSASTLKQGRNIDKMLKYVVSSSKQISQLYNDIHYSAFSQKDDSLDENIELDKLILDSVDFFQDISVTKNIKIETKISSCNIYMDRTKTQKIVNNLISNAIKYSHKDSKIIITLENDILYVKDFGIGISEKDQKIVFKRYKRGKNFEGGFGIGLDIVSSVCKEYNLKLNLESVIKEGSTFSIDFSSVCK